MTIPRRGGRALHVDGHALRFWVRRGGTRLCPDCDRLYVILVAADRAGSALVLQFPEPSAPEDPQISPRLVAELARTALQHGWEPGKGQGSAALGPEAWAAIGALLATARADASHARRETRSG